MGFGLVICKGLFELMKGKMLFVVSEVGKGILIIFVLFFLFVEDVSKVFLEGFFIDKFFVKLFLLLFEVECVKGEIKLISVLVVEDNKVK